MTESNQFLIKERVGLMKMRNVYDIIDLATGSQIGTAREDTPSWILALGFLVNRRLLPATLVISKTDDTPLVRLNRKMSLVSKVEIKDAQNRRIGWFKSKFMSLRSKFRIFDVDENQIGEVKGDWKGWNFSIVDAESKQLGVITKKWAGLGKELFTTADNYVVSVNRQTGSEAQKLLLLAAGIAIDTVYKESKN
ncbi:MAG: phospholipid scramblase-related protein [Chitinispirillaceae bacterium]